jgi:lipid-A-disaccharide synthase
VQARGVAGPAMRAAGVEPLARVEDLSVNGLWEVLGKLPTIRAAQAAVRAAMEPAPDLLITVDAPDFHLPLARHARGLGIPAIGYVSPQVWAWRPGRARSLARDLDRLLCLFPFEPPLYTPHGLDARFVGHPVIDRLAGQTRAPVPGRFALLPGSREHELERLLPVFLEAAALVRQQQPEASFVLGVAEGCDPSLVAQAEDRGVELVQGLVPAALGCQAALVASGTATLELAVLGVPMVVAYRVHASTYAIGRALVKGIEHIALPNILAGRAVVPEHIQHLEPAALARDLLAVAGDPELPSRLAAVKAALGEPGASMRAARAALEPV